VYLDGGPKAFAQVGQGQSSANMARSLYAAPGHSVRKNSGSIQRWSLYCMQHQVIGAPALAAEETRLVGHSRCRSPPSKHILS
jgi:hypothetical protein